MPVLELIVKSLPPCGWHFQPRARVVVRNSTRSRSEFVFVLWDGKIFIAVSEKVGQIDFHEEIKNKNKNVRLRRLSALPPYISTMRPHLWPKSLAFNCAVAPLSFGNPILLRKPSLSPRRYRGWRANKSEENAHR